jgi:hypothetical protein
MLRVSTYRDDPLVPFFRRFVTRADHVPGECVSPTPRYCAAHRQLSQTLPFVN